VRSRRRIRAATNCQIRLYQGGAGRRAPLRVSSLRCRPLRVGGVDSLCLARIGTMPGSSGPGEGRRFGSGIVVRERGREKLLPYSARDAELESVSEQCGQLRLLSSSAQAVSQRRHASPHRRQCSCISA
jgi:hypothetical protein